MILERTHVEGAVWTGAGAVGGLVSWFLEHIEAINSVMHFLVLAVSLVAAIVGLRKLLK